jgi:hypothetical protein
MTIVATRGQYTDSLTEGPISVFQGTVLLSFRPSSRAVSSLPHRLITETDPIRGQSCLRLSPRLVPGMERPMVTSIRSPTSPRYRTDWLFASLDDRSGFTDYGGISVRNRDTIAQCSCRFHAIIDSDSTPTTTLFHRLFTLQKYKFRDIFIFCVRVSGRGSRDMACLPPVKS